MGRIPAIWLVLGAIVSIQAGAAAGKSLFGLTHPLGIAWLRLAVAAVLLLIIARPCLRGRTRGDWLLIGTFAVCLTTMNSVIYLAFMRLPIGVAVTLEFLGPLAVAIWGSRRFRDWLWVLLAGAGVALLGLSRGVSSFSWVGAALALLAGAMWAVYIVVGEKLSHRVRPVDTLSLACAFGAVVLAPVGWSLAGSTLLQPHVLLVGALVGLLSTVLPYTFELHALGRVPKRLFSILMSIEPAVAALVAFLFLRELLSWPQILAIGFVIIASAGATWSARPPRVVDATAP